MEKYLKSINKKNIKTENNLFLKNISDSQSRRNKNFLNFDLKNEIKGIINFQKYQNIVFMEEYNFLEIISEFCSLIKTKKSLDEIHTCFNFYAAKLGYNFTALCIPDKKSGQLIVKTYDENEKLNFFQFSLSDNDNYIVQSYLDKTKKNTNYKNLFKINCPEKNEYLLMPLKHQDECFGMVITGSDKKTGNNDKFINILSNYLMILISNYNLRENLSLQ